jgi:hypothetical protein
MTNSASKVSKKKAPRKKSGAKTSGAKKVEGKGADLFEELARPLLKRRQVTRGTMMGFPCLRAKGGFFACVHHDGTNLIVKLPANRVNEAVASGEGEPFAPAGRVFREWLEVPLARSASWNDLLAEAYAFVAGSS